MVRIWETLLYQRLMSREKFMTRAALLLNRISELVFVLTILKALVIGGIPIPKAPSAWVRFLMVAGN